MYLATSFLSKVIVVAALDQLRATCQIHLENHISFFQKPFSFTLLSLQLLYFAQPHLIAFGLVDLCSPRFIACSSRYTSFPVHFADHLDDDANSFRACFNVSLNVARSILCLSARKSYDFEPQLWLVRNRGSRETFSQQSVLFHFISKGNWSCSFWDFKLQPPFVFSSLARHLRCNFNRPTNVIC